MHSSRRPARALAASLVVLSVAAALIAIFGLRERPHARAGIEKRQREIEFEATVHAAPFDDGWLMRGYHAVVGKGGRMSHAALLRAGVTDLEVIEALEAIGARPGNNLPMASWTARNDPGSPAPDLAIAGTEVEVLLRLPGRPALVPLAAILEDGGGRGMVFRFGGNRANVPAWKSGCIVCLYSCPGSKVGNARYTVRDYARGATRFHTRPNLLPPDGTPVRVVLRLAPAG